MSARRKARQAALALLFEADQRSVDLLGLLRERQETATSETMVRPYTAQIVEGVAQQWVPINEALSTYSKGWTLSRMPAVDRSLLRIGAWEVIYNDDVPDGVAVSEATELAAELSTDNSPQFISGLLSTLGDLKGSLR